uniref:PHLPP-like RA domain-containing protein n=1 Tax=Ursus americanus TaxID=9643 RepID=A0A452QVF1_URSAM
LFTGCPSPRPAQEPPETALPAPPSAYAPRRVLFILNQPRLPCLSAQSRPGAGARPPSPPASPPPLLPKDPRGVDGPGGAARDRPREEKEAAAAALSRPQPTPGGNGAASEKAPPPPTLYVQLHGETTRRLEAHEKPLQIQNDYLFQLGFGELWRVQEEGMDSEIGCLIRFYAGKPHSTGSSERIQLSGMYNVRKGKMQLPVNRWTRRQVILCGTCLIVSSVKDSLTGKMHVLPLIGGKISFYSLFKYYVI